MNNKLDYAIIDWISDNLSSPFMDKLMVFFTRLGDSGLIWVTICALLLISKKTRYVGFIALVSLLFSQISVNFILKDLFQRGRPFVNFPEMEILIERLDTYSFPSGHTASSFAAAFVFGKYFDKPYSTLAYILAILISFSRMYLYVHYPSDVFFGFIIGLLCSALAVLLFDNYKKYQERKLNVKNN